MKVIHCFSKKAWNVPPKTKGGRGKRDALQVYMNMFGKRNTPKPNFKFQVGDKVRISKEKMKFEKGYYQSWSVEIFVVAQRLKREPAVYKLKDQKGLEIDSIFYNQDLQL